MNELDIMVDAAIAKVNLTGGKVTPKMMYDIFVSYNTFDKELYAPLDADRIRRIDKLFDYENSGFECFTETYEDKTNFSTRNNDNDLKKYRGKIIISVKEMSLEFVMKETIKFLIDSKIYSSGTVSKINKNDSICIGLSNQKDINNLFVFLQSDEIKKHLSALTPAIPNYAGVGYVNYSGKGDYLYKFSELFATVSNNLFKQQMLEYFSLSFFSELLNKSYATGRISVDSGVIDVANTAVELNSLNVSKKNSI